MKTFLDFIGFILLCLVVFVLFGKISFDPTNTNVQFNRMDEVYILPDSTEAIVQGGIFISKVKKDDIKELFVEYYKVMYTDKVGEIHYLKSLPPELIVKR